LFDFFFFSSRRRHTRFSRDWSSDVCSSDLAAKFRKKSSHSDVGNHVRNFLDCIASRDKPNCSIETGRNVALYAHMGNIAARSGDGKITWQAERQSFDNSKAANALIMPQYRNAWKLPSI